MEADDQLRAVENAGKGNLVLSANAVGSSSGIRSFNGRVITNAAAVRATDTLKLHKQNWTEMLIWAEGLLTCLG